MEKIILKYTQDNILKAEFVFSKDQKEKEYAFYLLKDGKKVDERWYRKEPSVSFQIKETGTYSIRGFIQDRKANDKKSYNSKNIFINLGKSNLRNILLKEFVENARNKKKKNLANLEIKYINVNNSRLNYNFIEIDNDIIDNNSVLKNKKIFISKDNLILTIPRYKTTNLQITANYKINFQFELIEINNDEFENYYSYQINDENNIIPLQREKAFLKYIIILVFEKKKLPKDLLLTLNFSIPQEYPSHCYLSQHNFIPVSHDTFFSKFTCNDIPENIDQIPKLDPKKTNFDTRKIQPVEQKPFFLTVDVESFYFKRPSMITGESLNGAKAIYEIIDELNKRNLKAVFYVNVYEHLQYTDDVIKEVCQYIVKTGHEIALHSHKSKDLNFYNKEIIHYKYDNQYKTLKYGKDIIYKWTGYNVINFRAGGYAHNSDTLKALQDLGFQIDSSYFFKHSNTIEHTGKYLLPYLINKNLIEVPVLYVPVVIPDGKIEHRKLDINSINYHDLISIIDRSMEYLPVFNYMMHSFSFIKRKRFTKKDDNVLLRSDTLNSKGVYMGVTSLDNKLFADFCKFLDYLVYNQRLKVVTMANSIDYLKNIAQNNEKYKNIIPIIYR